MNDLASPTQERSKQALERFLNVAAELLANNTFEETSISQITKLAKSSVGTFYRLLGDKDVLLYAVHDRFVEECETAIDQAIELILQSDLDAKKQIESVIHTLIELFRNREGLLRALIRRSSVDLKFRQRFHGLNAYIANAFCRIALAHLLTIQHPNPTQAIDMVAHLLLASLNYYTMTGSLGVTAEEDIPTELSRLLLNYLEVSSTN
ncbi:TetR/AcrR family transcriptional regulator [Pseudomonas sp. LS44]|uniref:TetR/AcrR family transcriptional regulator n=1 Tax=Pseudomonas sp. LS44 TaxID=1357074 RepID=UPI00215AD6FB|nr:TetR/AcrR family transcriptional regulator [Pseudomonas sp. LS44]UVE17962.1 TetR/AcrR family transcriptional regulator [Pseudomonas sp. LS44]